VILVNDQTILRAVDPEFLEQRFHSGGEGEVSRSSLFLEDHNSKLIHNLGLAYRFENRTSKATCNDLGIVAGEEFRNSSDSVANDIVQQLPGQSADPMLFIP
jgi:hypothetical protein